MAHTRVKCFWVDLREGSKMNEVTNEAIVIPSQIALRGSRWPQEWSLRTNPCHKRGLRAR